MSYKFGLNIVDEIKGYSPENGLPYGDLGSLIRSLDSAINPKDNTKCTLFKIQNHGYTPYFITESVRTYNNFIDVHKNIYERPIYSLNKRENIYARVLSKILKRGQYIEALNNEDQPICKITSDQIKKGVDSYNLITNISGVISEIGSRSLKDDSHIYLDGLDYKIYINEQQDYQLKEYYKFGRLDFRLKQKIAIDSNRIINAKLIDYKLKSELSFTENMSRLSEDDLSYLKDVNTLDDILKLIRS
ncbi:MAG: hypothetical protein IPG55_12525 [Saprospiraceae bacterium]|nr:hypothetical protein [Candidatus Defluviibacterium haderslevense]MBK7244384.1 hypothetical protein [Candidatus Defluviibacterium haderslevense]